MSLESIPLTVVPATPATIALTGNARPLVHEIAEHVRRLLATGEATTIDLSALPLTPSDLEWLRARLGEGEVVVTLDANGESTLAETASPGVWWVTHRNEKGNVVAQFIEVAFVPELVRAHPSDVALGLERLEALAAAHEETGTTTP